MIVGIINHVYDNYSYYLIGSVIIVGSLSTILTDLLLNKHKNIEKPLSKTELYLRKIDVLFDRAISNPIDTDNYKNSPNKNTWILENVPIPNNDIIAMNYDAQKNVFTYYSNSRTIPYHILDAVCKKFCAQHKCTSIYTKMEVLEKELEKKHQLPKITNAPTFSKNSSFTKVIKKKMNSFLRKGSIREFSFIGISDNNKLPSNTHVTLSFAEFKNKLKNDNL